MFNILLFFNYVDDNTEGIAHKDLNELKGQLVKCTEKANKWFESNHMKSNTLEFQAMIMKPYPSTEPIMVDIVGQSMQPNDCVKLLGVHVDDKLRFQNHKYVICLRASRQINALNRSNFLYCFIIWHFYSSYCTYKMDLIQLRALRVVLNDYQSSYKDLLKEVNRPTVCVPYEDHCYWNV